MVEAYREMAHAARRRLSKHKSSHYSRYGAAGPPAEKAEKIQAALELPKRAAKKTAATKTAAKKSVAKKATHK